MQLILSRLDSRQQSNCPLSCVDSDDDHHHTHKEAEDRGVPVTRLTVESVTQVTGREERALLSNGIDISPCCYLIHESPGPE